MPKTLVWFRGKDLRLADHAALSAAAEHGQVIPLFVFDPQFHAGAGARERPHRAQFLLESLRALEANLAAKGSRLLVVAGQSAELVPRLAHELRVERVVALSAVEPRGRARDARVSAALGERFALHEGETLASKQSLRSGSGDPYTVFTPFARAFAQRVIVGPPLPVPRALGPLPVWPAAVARLHVEIPSGESLGVTPNPRLLRGGERAARARLRAFLDERAPQYHAQRDRMDLEGTSRLSADLHFGTLSARSVFDAASRHIELDDARSAFLNELVWREFAHSAMWDRPALMHEPFRSAFADFPYRDDPAAWRAWTAGTTGYPIVDASARQLLAEGFVHNRARMISASFLTKHLLIDYRRGEGHYLKYLTDGDLANNNAGWQWSAGCGCDAQPYFRIFNPVTQGTKFDPDGTYVRRWVPELSALPARFIHRPWEAPAQLRRALQYPDPIVDHRDARERFLALATQHLQR